MNSIKLWQTASIPSRFGMPISGRAFRAVTPVAVREREAVVTAACAATGHAGFAKPDFPVTTAWRPPTC